MAVQGPAYGHPVLALVAGVLDVIDGFMFAVVVSYYYMLLVS